MTAQVGLDNRTPQERDAVKNALNTNISHVSPAPYLKIDTDTSFGTRDLGINQAAADKTIKAIEEFKSRVTSYTSDQIDAIRAAVGYSARAEQGKLENRDNEKQKKAEAMRLASARMQQRLSQPYSLKESEVLSQPEPQPEMQPLGEPMQFAQSRGVPNFQMSPHAKLENHRIMTSNQNQITQYRLEIMRNSLDSLV